MASTEGKVTQVTHTWSHFHKCRSGMSVIAGLLAGVCRLFISFGNYATSYVILLSLNF